MGGISLGSQASSCFDVVLCVCERERESVRVRERESESVFVVFTAPCMRVKAYDTMSMPCTQHRNEFSCTDYTRALRPFIALTVLRGVFAAGQRMSTRNA